MTESDCAVAVDLNSDMSRFTPGGAMGVSDNPVIDHLAILEFLTPPNSSHGVVYFLFAVTVVDTIRIRIGIQFRRKVHVGSDGATLKSNFWI